MPTGVVTVVRHALSLKDLPQWATDDSTMAPLEVAVDTRIEDTGEDCLHVDFANRFIGGGVLGRGAVQEEIRFVLNPELLVACLLCPAMAANESIVIKGAQRFSNYTGYAGTFQYAGQHLDTRSCDAWRRIETQVVAIDATAFSDANLQYGGRYVRRELNKCFCGFGTPHTESGERGASEETGLRRQRGGARSSESWAKYARGQLDAAGVLNRLPCVATGNWGSGAFNGDVYLKSTLQMMVCAVARKKMLYCTFGNRELGEKLTTMHQALIQYGVTVGQLFGLVEKYCFLYNAHTISMDVIVFVIDSLHNSM